MLLKTIVTAIFLFISSMASSFTVVDLSDIENFAALPGQVSLLEDQELEPIAALEKAISAKNLQKMPAFSSKHLWQLYRLDSSLLTEDVNQFHLVKMTEYLANYDVYLFNANHQLIAEDHLGLSDDSVYQKQVAYRQSMTLPLIGRDHFYLLIHMYSDQIQGNENRIYTTEAFQNQRSLSAGMSAFL
ncbi:MAG: hypothetical protein OEY29_15735, partial [Gammaproteobacteria bacterium]|nr:hypothetical protein [Gammaproteobacteria bacterium]